MSQIQLLFPVLSTFHVQKLVIIITIIGLLNNGEYIKNIQSVMRNRLGSLLIFLVAWIIMSVPLGVYPGHSLTFLSTSYWKLIVTLLLLLGYVTSISRFEKLIWIYILSVGFLGLVTIKGADAARVSINNDIYDPNDTALQFLLALPFAFWQFKWHTGLKKIVAAAVCVILIIGMVKTGSRGGFLGLIFVIIVSFFHLKNYENRSFLRVFLLLGIGGAVFYHLADPSYIERISTITNPSSDYNITSKTGRIQIWERGIDMMLSNPLLGVGVDNFITADGLLYLEEGARYNTAHNSFVQVGAELGAPGLIAFCLLIWNSTRYARVITKKRSESGEIIYDNINSYAIIAAWMGFTISGSFLSAAYTSSFYFLLGLSMSFIYLESRSAATPENSPSL